MSDIVIEGKNLKDIDQSNFQSVGPYTNPNETQVKEPWQGRYKLSGSEDTDLRFDLGTYTDNERGFWEIQTTDPNTRLSQFESKDLQTARVKVVDGLAVSDEVKWSVDTFPFVGGVSGIVMSWILSPLFSALIAAFVFYITRNCVLRQNFNSNRLNLAYPILIGSTMTINTFFIIYKGAKGLGLDKIPVGIALSIAFGAGGISALITIPLVPKLKNYVKQKFSNENKQEIEMPSVEEELNANKDKFNIKDDSEMKIVSNIHTNAEKFDKKTEEVFKFLQVFTAICDAFSHGANDVANSIGPFVAIYTIYNANGVLEKKNNMEDDAYWILAMGGVGIGLGLLVYGHKITYAIGEKLCKITPSRGVAIELSSALVIITGSRLKIPLSTTHCQVGATVGVGLLENPKNCAGINCKIFGKTVLGWLVTCVIVGLTSALFISLGAFSPTATGWETCTTNHTV